MLGMDKGISDKTDMAHYAYEVLGGHCVPFVSIDLRVVDLSSVNEGDETVSKGAYHQSRSKYSTQPFPVLVIIAITPFKCNLRQCEEFCMSTN